MNRMYLSTNEGLADISLSTPSNWFDTWFTKGVKILNATTKEPYITEVTDEVWTFKAPAPGLKSKKVSAKVKGNLLTVHIPETTFTEELNLRFRFSSDIKKPSITSKLEDGIFSVNVEFSKDESFNVDVE